MNQTEREYLFCNTKTQKISGDDTSFQLSFSKFYRCKKMYLEKMLFTDQFANIYGIYQNFSFFTGVGDEDIYLPIKHYTIDSLIAELNAQQSSVVFSYTDEQESNIITVTGDIQWYPKGDAYGWQKLGFDYPFNSSGLQFSITSPRMYDLSTSPVIYIQIQNLPSNYSGNDGMVQYMVQLDSSFGDKYVYDPNVKQCVDFKQQIGFNYFAINLLDSEFKKIYTYGDNVSNVGFFFSFILEN